MCRFNDGHSSTSEAVTSFPAAHRNSTQVMFSTATAIVALDRLPCALPHWSLLRWLYSSLFLQFSGKRPQCSPPSGSECPVVDQSASNSQTGMFFNISFEENSLDPQQTITSALRETQSVFISNKCLYVYLYDLFIYLTFRYILHICIILYFIIIWNMFKLKYTMCEIYIYSYKLLLFSFPCFF